MSVEKLGDVNFAVSCKPRNRRPWSAASRCSLLRLHRRPSGSSPRSPPKPTPPARWRTGCLLHDPVYRELWGRPSADDTQGRRCRDAAGRSPRRRASHPLTPREPRLHRRPRRLLPSRRPDFQRGADGYANICRAVAPPTPATSKAGLLRPLADRAVAPRRHLADQGAPGTRHPHSALLYAPRPSRPRALHHPHLRHAGWRSRGSRRRRSTRRSHLQSPHALHMPGHIFARLGCGRRISTPTSLP